MIKKLRASRLIIEMPTEDGPVWIHAELQNAFKDKTSYKTMQLVDRTGYVHREFTQVASDMLKITDPVTSKKIDISVAGVTEAIKYTVIEWMIKDKGGKKNDKGDLILEE